MQERIRMNTESLQEAFPEVYEDFFVNHDMVVSGCFSLAWSPVGVGEHNILNYIKQKLPTKSYVWFNFNKNKGVKIKDAYFYNLNTRSFEKFAFEDINIKKDILVEYLTKLKNKLEIESWVEISIFSENMRGHWMWFAGTLSAVITTWMYVLSWKLTEEELNDYDRFISSDIFKEIHLWARKQDYISRYGRSIWENPFFTLSNIDSPLLYMNDSNIADSEDDLDNSNMKYINIFEELALWDNYRWIPFDYAMIFSWIQNNTQQVEYYRDLDLVKWNKVKDFISKKILLEKNNIYWFSSILENWAIQDGYNKIMLTLNAQFLFYFEKVINEWYEMTNVDNFIQQINLYRYAISLVEHQNNFADDFIKNFDNKKTNYSEKIGIMPVYSGKFWGWYLILMKENISRITLNSVVYELKKLYNGCEIEYASWIDGKSSDWVKLEQYASEWLYSKYFDENKLILETNKGKKILWEREDLMWEIEKWIIIDQISRKVFVNWEKLTSKDIPSQATTADVLWELVANIWKEIPNNVFESSSYSKNKNDMIGKIIIPLTKLTKKYFDKEIDIVCKGSLIEFYMILQEEDIEIGVIKKLI